MKENKFLFVVVIAVVLATVFFIGRKTVNTESKTEYIKQEPVTGNISGSFLQPEKEEIPVNPHLPVKIDTVYKYNIKYIVQNVDTAAIISDYIMKKSYNVIAFDNKEIGSLRIFPTVQYNQLSGLSYEFTPIQKQTTIHKEKVWNPFLSGSYSTFGNIGLGGGIFYHNLGIEYQYQKDLLSKNNGHLFGLKYKF